MAPGSYPFPSSANTSRKAVHCWRLFLLLVLCGMLLLCPPAAALAQSRVLVVDVDGVVHPITVEILQSATQQCADGGCDALLLRLNTPGGLMDAMRESVEVIVASPVPVITYVTPGGARAASAGFFLLQAGDIAAMAPGTNTGAASPVLMGEKMDPVMRKKIEEDASASLRSVVSRRGRNAELAEQTVLQAKAFTEQEALDQNLIDLIAASEAVLFEKLQGTEFSSWSGEKRTLHLENPQLVEYQPRWRERLMSAISDPNIAFILTILGVLGIYVEFSSPGLILPGVAGAISILLGLSALSILPINWMGVALLVLAMVLFVLEANIPSHGILGVGGALAMALGAILLVDSPLPELRIHASVAIAVSVGFSAITIFLLSLVIRAMRNKVATGAESLPGRIATAVEDLAPRGRVLLDGDYWNAVASVPIRKGQTVRVRSMDGLTLTVEPESSTTIP